MTVSVFSIVKNEVRFIPYCVLSILPYVDEIVYADGNSTDGTLEVLDYISRKYDTEGKLKVLKGWDCANLQEDYVRLFNDLMKQCKGDYLFYLHPDMMITNPEKLREIGKDGAPLAYYVNMRSFAGEDLMTEIVKGRTNKWKLIMKNAFGLHYHGFYGAANEDMYFADITGKEHKLYMDMRQYPYEVKDSGLHIQHFCECKPRKRREEKMRNVCVNAYGLKEGVHLDDVVFNHPRVHLEDSSCVYGTFKFEPRKDPLPEVFAKYKEEIETFGNQLDMGRKS